jgi:precorrin-8X/cobalt-precorrin-8 methylmutase
MHGQAWNMKPDDIETRSLAIIDAEAGDHGWPPQDWAVIRRMIHTTADFDWPEITLIHEKALASGMRALSEGCTIFTDTQMAKMGISSWRIDSFEVDVRCLIADQKVGALASREGSTRAVASMDLAVDLDPAAVFVIGNAPTALLRLLEHCRSGKARPQLVVGLPVGFVNAAEAKHALAQTDLPFITAKGRKGGSAVAASVINSLAIMALENRQ